MPRGNGDLTQEDILAWADGVVGVPATETAQKQGCHIHTFAQRLSLLWLLGL